MARKEDAKQITANVEPELSKEIEDYKKESGLSTNALVNKALEFYLLDALTYKIPNQSDLIEDFESHLNSLIVILRSAMDLSIYAKENAQKEVKSQLDALSQSALKCEQLQEEVKRLSQEKEQNLSKISDQALRIKELEQEVQRLRTNAESVDDLKGQIVSLREENISLKEEYNKIIEEARKDFWDKCLEIVRESQKK